MTNLEIRKGIQDIEKWDKEHIFYNPLFLTEDGKTLSITKYCEKNNIYIFEQLLDEKVKESMKQPFDKVLTNMLKKILINTSVPKDDILFINNGKEIQLSQATQKNLYEASLATNYRDHHSQAKWVTEINNSINWGKVWTAVHNILSTNQTKSTIWQHIHLNFYTQYSYNKWHKTKQKCPLCKKIPDNIFHIILYCDFTNTLWRDIEPVLMELHPTSVSLEEKAFGITQEKVTTGILLRNWITYLLRDCISQEERAAYYTLQPSIEKVKVKLNVALDFEIYQKILRYRNNNNLDFFDKIITHAGVLCIKQCNEEYQVKRPYK